MNIKKYNTKTVNNHACARSVCVCVTGRERARDVTPRPGQREGN